MKPTSLIYRLLCATVLVLTIFLFWSKWSSRSRLNTKVIRDLSLCRTVSRPLDFEFPDFKVLPRQFAVAEMENIAMCKKQNLTKEHKQSWDRFFTNGTHAVRYNSHTYLNSKSKVIEIGGNIGETADIVQRRFKPGTYYT